MTAPCPLKPRRRPRPVPLLCLTLAAALAGAPDVARAQATSGFTTSLVNWGRISIYGPETTSSGGATTELRDVRDEWDHDADGRITYPTDGVLVQNVWTSVDIVGGTPRFRSYHDLDGYNIPFHDGQGWTGFRTHASLNDMWTLTVPWLPVGTPLQVQLTFGLHARMGDLFGPGGSVGLPPNFYPYYAGYGSPPGTLIPGPWPQLPTMSMGLEIGNYQWADTIQVTGEGTHAVVFGDSDFFGLLELENGRPFEVTASFSAGWRMEHADVAFILGAAYETFSTNRVWDASSTARFTGLQVTDPDGAIITSGWSLTDSSGAAVVPAALVPEPAAVAGWAGVVTALAAIAIRGRRRPRVAPETRMGR